MSQSFCEDHEEHFQPIATFILKIYTILNQPENAQAIAWHAEGSSFIIKNVSLLTHSILPRHFRHHKYESFIRQLNMYSFNKVRHADGPAFLNRYFLRGQDDLLRFIKRKPEKKKKKQFQEELPNEKENTIKMITEENCPPAKKDALAEQEELVPSLKEEPLKPAENVKKVHFAESVAETRVERFSMIEPSCKWLTNKEESVWQNIKSFNSFKISMKLLGLEGEVGGASGAQEAAEASGEEVESSPKLTESGLATLRHLDLS